MEETIPDKVTAIISLYQSKDITSDESLQNRNRIVDSIEKLCQSKAAMNGGECSVVPASMNLGDAFRLEVPVDNIHIIRDILEQAKEDMSAKMCAGVGHDLIEAKYATEHAIHEGPGTIKVYHPDMEAPEEESSEELTKADGGKSEAIKLLSKIKASLPVFEQMKQTRPDLYNQAVTMMQGMIQAVAEQKGLELKESEDKDTAAIEQLIEQFQQQYDESEDEEAKQALADQSQNQPSEQPRKEEDEEPQTLRSGLSQQLLDHVWEQSFKKKQHERPDFSNEDDPDFANALYDVIMSDDNA